MPAQESGCLRLKDDRFQFTTVGDVFSEYYQCCQLGSKSHPVFGCPVSVSVLRGDDGQARSVLKPINCLGQKFVDTIKAFDRLYPLSADDYGQQNPLVILNKIDPPKPKTKPKPTTSVLDKGHGDGGPLGDDDTEEGGHEWVTIPDEYDELANPDNSEDEHAVLEWGPDDIEEHAKQTAEEINTGLQINTTKDLARSTSVVEALVSHLAKEHADSGVVLTSEELEEEAVLMLVRNFDKDKACFDDTEIQQAANRLETEASKSMAAAPGVLFSASEDPSSEDSGGGGDACLGNTGESSAVVPKFLLIWKNSFNDTVSALKDQRRRSGLILGQNEEVSLVLFTPDSFLGSQQLVDNDESMPNHHQLTFVKWTDTSTLHGRPVRVDSGNRLVWSPNILFGKAIQSKQYSTRNHTILINACGAASKRYRGQGGALRDQLPGTVVRLAKFIGIACAYKDGEPYLVHSLFFQFC